MATAVGTSASQQQSEKSSAPLSVTSECTYSSVPPTPCNDVPAATASTPLQHLSRWGQNRYCLLCLKKSIEDNNVFVPITILPPPGFSSTRLFLTLTQLPHLLPSPHIACHPIAAAAGNNADISTATTLKVMPNHDEHLHSSHPPPPLLPLLPPLSHSSPPSTSTCSLLSSFL